MATKRLTTKTFPSGLRVAVVPDSHAATVTALVLVHVGSAFETEKENGLSHFLEHVCFKGTKRRSTAKLLAEEIESLGAVCNAFTDREYTGYFIKGNPLHTDQYVDILADIYQQSTFPEAEIEKEKGVIVEEINMYEDIPQSKVGDVLFEMLYPHHAMGRSILGTKETVRAFNRNDFLSYKKRYYTATNTTIVFAGNITPAKATALTRIHFKGLLKGKKNKREKVKDDQHVPVTKLFSRTTDQTHFSLTFRSLALGHKDLVAVRLLATILGRGMSSRLSLLLREELGAAYYVYASQESFIDQGIFSINAGIDKRRLEEIIERIVQECQILKTEKISSVELEKAKEYSIGTLRLGLELSDDVASFYGAQMVLEQKLRTPEEIIAAIKKITATDIVRVARLLFRPEKVNLAVVGPFTEKDIPKAIFRTL